MKFVFVVAVAAAEDLLPWFQKQGGELNGVDVRYTVAEGRGLFAMTPLAKGAVAVRVPAAAVLRPATCLDDPNSKLQAIPAKVRTQLQQNPALTALCVAELRESRASKWAPYLAPLAAPEDLLLIAATREDLNRTLEGSQLLREVQQKSADIAKLYRELEGYLQKPPLASWCPLQEFVETYALVESRSHSEGTGIAALPVADLLNHARAPNVELRRTDHGVEVVALRDLAQGEELYISYLANHGQRRSSFYRQFAVDDLSLPNDIKLGFHLRPTDPEYEAKKLRFPPHMVEAKKLYAELAHLLPSAKKAELPQALSFPHYLQLTCSAGDIEPQPHSVLPFLRFVVAPRVPTEEECPGTPPACPFLGADVEQKAERRLQADLVQYRAEYQDFASPRAGGAGRLLDDERRCLDAFLAGAGAPPPPVVGLYSGCGFLVLLSGLALFRVQHALWAPQ